MLRDDQGVMKSTPVPKCVDRSGFRFMGLPAVYGYVVQCRTIQTPTIKITPSSQVQHLHLDGDL